MMKLYGHRLSFTHLVFYISTFVILSQLWSVWKQSSHSYLSYTPSSWQFDPDLHANVHTLSNEQCDIAFPKLYRGLHEAVQRRKGKKVEVKDIEIAEGRCMLRVMIYDGEVGRNPSIAHFPYSVQDHRFVSSPRLLQEDMANSGEALRCRLRVA